MVTRGHRVAAYPLWTVLTGNMSGECRQSALRGRISTTPHAAHDRKCRGDIDDRRAGFHVRQNVARQAERCSQHETNEVVERLVVCFMKRLGTADARIVDQEVNVPPSGNGQVHDPLRCVIVG
jgi:hypothetical protein